LAVKGNLSLFKSDFCINRTFVKRLLILMTITFACKLSFGQKIESIYFNLYTDSLKKGFYNYISVDGKDEEGHWQPLDSSKIAFSCNTGFFKGNDLFIDSSYTGETVTVKAFLKSNPSIKKEITIYIRKRPFNEPLKTNEEILNEMKIKRKKK
jgi:hypothetical protein